MKIRDGRVGETVDTRGEDILLVEHGNVSAGIGVLPDGSEGRSWVMLTLIGRNASTNEPMEVAASIPADSIPGLVALVVKSLRTLPPTVVEAVEEGR